MRRKSRVISLSWLCYFGFQRKRNIQFSLAMLIFLFLFILWRKRNYGNMAVAILISLYVSHIFLTNKSLRELMGFGLYKKTQHFFFYIWNFAEFDDYIYLNVFQILYTRTIVYFGSSVLGVQAFLLLCDSIHEMINV